MTSGDVMKKPRRKPGPFSLKTVILSIYTYRNEVIVRDDYIYKMRKITLWAI